MTKSITPPFVDIHFALLQILVPTLEAEWGPEDGYQLVRELGDRLRRVMHDLESIEA